MLKKNGEPRKYKGTKPSNDGRYSPKIEKDINQRLDDYCYRHDVDKQYIVETSIIYYLDHAKEIEDAEMRREIDGMTEAEAKTTLKELLGLDGGET